MGSDGGGPLTVLDTHALLWLYRGDPSLGSGSRRLCDVALTQQDLAVSAISFWEIAMLVERRRLMIHQPLAEWRQEVLRLGILEVVVDGAMGIEAETLSGLHRDPADRLIVATAIRRGARLVTADQRILAWPGPLDRHDARS